MFSLNQTLNEHSITTTQIVLSWVKSYSTWRKTKKLQGSLMYVKAGRTEGLSACWSTLGKNKKSPLWEWALSRTVRPRDGCYKLPNSRENSSRGCLLPNHTRDINIKIQFLLCPLEDKELPPDMQVLKEHLSIEQWTVSP